MCCIPRPTALLHTGQLFFNFIHAIHTYLTTPVFIPAVFESELLPVKVQVQWTDADSGSEHQLREHQSRLPPSSRGSSASTCLLFLLLFSLGIPAREVPPLVWGSLWHPAALLSFHLPAGCLWNVRFLSGYRLGCEGLQCCAVQQGLAGSP